MSYLGKITLLSLSFSLLLWGCSEVNLNYGIGGNGLTSISDRNRNASTPANFEELTGTAVQELSDRPVGSSDGTGGDSGSSSNNSPAVTVPGAETPPAEESPVPVLEGTRHEGKVNHLRLIPEGPYYLVGSGDHRQIEYVLEDSQDHKLPPGNYEIVWEVADPGVLKLDGDQITSLVPSGHTVVSGHLKDNPDIHAQVDVYVGDAAPGPLGDYQVRLVPAGPIYLDGKGDHQNVTILMEDQQGNSVDPENFDLVYEFFNPSLAYYEDGNIISKVSHGETQMLVYIKDDPNSRILVDVIVESGGGGGGGGSTPSPTPEPKDNVTGIVIFE